MISASHSKKFSSDLGPGETPLVDTRDVGATTNLLLYLQVNSMSTLKEIVAHNSYSCHFLHDSRTFVLC